MKLLLNTDVHYHRSLFLSLGSVENYITYHFLLHTTLNNLFFKFKYVIILITKLKLSHILFFCLGLEFFLICLCSTHLVYTIEVPVSVESQKKHVLQLQKRVYFIFVIFYL